MMRIADGTVGGWPIEIENEGIVIHCIAQNPAEILNAVAHFYMMPHDACDECPLCKYVDARERATRESKQR